jgi:SAM-dependent methyltransferase
MNSKFYDLLKSYGFCDGEEFNYLKTHFKRYLTTLELIPNNKVTNILELGASYPFTLMLKTSYPSADIELSSHRDSLDNSKKDSSCKIALRYQVDKTKNDLVFNLSKFNLEKEPWPYSDGYFDVVFCLEILEHLLLDPFFVFKEANRVLKDNGNFILTTPNIACYETLDKLIHCISPYRYGLYSCYGEYGRHNREYVPEEIKIIGEGAGFETSLLSTKDTYDNEIDLTKIKPFLNNYNDNPLMRGQTIFYRGLKKPDKAFKRYPEVLYDCDKDIHCAKFQILQIDNNITLGNKFDVKLIINNHGKYAWQNTGSNPTCIGIILLDSHKNLIERDFQRISLPKEIKPGGVIEILSSINTPNKRGIFTLRFDMVHENICWFSDASNPYYNYVDVDIEIR